MRTKTKKILGMTSLTLAGLGTLGAVSSVITVSCSKGNEKAYVINNDTVKIDDYKIFNDNATSFVQANGAINLKTLSEENNGIKKFVIEGNITHTIFIPSDFSCSLSGKKGSKITVGDDNVVGTLGVVGIIIGNDEPEQKSAYLKSDLKIYDTTISASTSTTIATGIYFRNDISAGTKVDIFNNIVSTSTTSSSSPLADITFNGFVFGTLKINDNTMTSNGLQITNNMKFVFDVDTDAKLDISNNVFYITSTSSAIQSCILFGDDVSSVSTYIVNNAFFLNTTGIARVLCFLGVNATNSETKIVIANNTFSIYCEGGGNSYVIGFVPKIYGILEIKNNVFSFIGSSTYNTECIEFGNDIYGTLKIENNIFSVSNTVGASTSVPASYGIYFLKYIRTDSNISIANNTFTSYSPYGCTCSLYLRESLEGTIKLNGNVFSDLGNTDAYCLYYVNGTPASTDVQCTIKNLFYSLTTTTAKTVNKNGLTPADFISNGTSGAGESASSVGVGTYTLDSFVAKIYYPIGTFANGANPKNNLVTKAKSYLTGSDKYTNSQCITFINELTF